jgi:hypothetical protein
VYNPRKTFGARRRRVARHNRRWHYRLRSTDHVFRKRISSPRKFLKNRRIFRNPNPDSTLRRDE